MPTLNRRSFLQSLTAAGLVPALPVLPAMAVPATAAHMSIQYTWACYYAQMNNACSVSQITSALGVRPEVAQGLFDRLVTQNIITAPGLSGVSVSRRRQMMNLRSGGAVTSKSAIQFDHDQLMAEISTISTRLRPRRQQTVHRLIRNRLRHDQRQHPARRNGGGNAQPDTPDVEIQHCDKYPDKERDAKPLAIEADP